jgi:hypothetical protein
MPKHKAIRISKKQYAKLQRLHELGTSAMRLQHDMERQFCKVLGLHHQTIPGCDLCSEAFGIKDTLDEALKVFGIRVRK